MFTEIKKTLAILKQRWPEVLLIIGISAMIWVVPEILIEDTPEDIESIPILPYTLLAGLSVLAGLLRFGFLRTVYTDGADSYHMPTQLIRVGVHFFWRMFAFGLLFGLSLVFVSSVFSYFLQQIFLGQGSVENVPIWLANLSVQAAFIVLIKIAIFVEPVIIVKDCRLFTAFRAFRYYRLLDAKVLIVLYFFQIVISYFTQVVISAQGQNEPANQIWFGAAAAVINFIDLIIAVMAIRFVSSVDLGYDTNLPDELIKTASEPSEDENKQY